MTFKDMGLHPMIIKAMDEENYKQPTPIQLQAMPSILKKRDLLGIAATGTGKTAAFAVPILNGLADRTKEEGVFNKVKALILAPTRELAIQIGESFETYGRHLDLTIGVVYGGVTPKRHIKVMNREPDILVATPGRLMDLDQRGYIDYSGIETLVLDEADRMLDLGMGKDVMSILARLPRKRQTLLFSATMPKQIQDMVHKLLNNPISVQIKSKPVQKQKVRQELYFVDPPEKTALLLDLIQEKKMASVLVFVRTKKQADKVCKAINVANVPGIRAKAIHGDKSQMERQKVMAMFKAKEIQILVASDVAARGIDIDDLSHVVNMNMPNVPETYIHRIGRTGRAGKAGTAISFCSLDELDELKAIEKQQKKTIPVVKNHGHLPLKLAIKQNRENYREKLSPEDQARRKQKRSKSTSNRKSSRNSQSRRTGPGKASGRPGKRKGTRS